MNRELRGILGPVVSTFGPDGAIADGPFRANIRAHLAAGLSGVVVAGSTGEAPLLDAHERQLFMRAAREEVPRDHWLIAGVGAESTRETIALAEQGVRDGADALLVMPPHYFSRAMTPTALATHYAAVADAVKAPVLLYNIPQFTHVVLDPAMVAELSTHEHIVGMKDSAGDMAMHARYRQSQSDAFTVLTGHGGTLAEALRGGTRGAILAVSLFAPSFALEIAKAVAAGDVTRADAAQAKLAPLALQVAGTLGVAGTKAALDAIGLSGGSVRAPLLPLGAADRERVHELLAAAGLLETIATP